MIQPSNADLIRKNITILEESIKTRLDESGFLLEMQTSVDQQLMPALKEMFEHYGLLMEQEAVPGEYSDEEILALVRHFGSIKKLIDAHKEQSSTGVDSAVVADADKNEKAIQTARRAIGTIITNADSNSPAVRDPAAFVADKNERLVSSVEAADRDGKFKNLVRIVKTWPSLAKNRKVANLLTVSTGVLIPLLSSGTWWAAPAAMMIVKTVFDRMQGQSWKQAVAKNVSVGAIASLIGFGAARAGEIDKIVASFENWSERPGEVPGYRGDSSVVGSQTSGEAGDYAPSNRGGSSFPGEVGYDQPDNRRSFPGEVGIDAASGTGFDIDWREHPTGLYTAVGGERIRNLDYASFYNSFEDFLADNPSLRSREYAEPGEIIRMIAIRPDNDDDSQIDSQTSGEAGDYGQTTNIQTREYTVQRGDTLSGIADKNGVSIKDLQQANTQLASLNPDQIIAGNDKVLIPSPTGNSVYQDGVGTASDTARKLASGQYRNR